MAYQLSFPVSGMNCASCVGRVEKALSEVKGVEDASVNLATGKVGVRLVSEDQIPDLTAALKAAGYPPQVTTTEFELDNLSCASCVGRAEAAMRALPEVTEANVNLATARAQVSVLNEDGLDHVRAALSRAGYPAREEAVQSGEDGLSHDETLKRDLILAVVLALPVFLVEMGGHFYPPFHHWVMAVIGQQTSWILQFTLAALVLIFPGRQFFAHGIPALLRGAPDMNSLVALGTSAAVLYSSVVTFVPGLLPAAARAVYFEAAVVIVALILLGRWLEARAKGRAGDAIRALIDLTPDEAHRVEGGQSLPVPVASLAPGDLLELRPGERVAVDGVVETGDSWVDESMLTGEPLAVAKTPSTALTAGTVNTTGALRYRATAVGRDTRLAQIVQMVETAQGAKLPVQALVDRVTLWFVPVVIAIALIALVAWWGLGPEPALVHALIAGVSVLIVACPCAMGLATPMSIMVATGRASQLGVLFRKGDALQTLDRVRMVAFDKTGTLTEGAPRVVSVQVAHGVDKDAVLTRVAALESNSEHPIAKALAAASHVQDLPSVTGFQSVTGQGVRGQVQGKELRIGNARLMQAGGIDVADWCTRFDASAQAGETPFFVAEGKAVVALISVTDPVKPDSAALIAHLKQAGVRVAMLSGDAELSARAIADRLGIEDVHANIAPEDKVATLQRLQAHRPLAFVGDGLNDGPALAAADVGIAMGTGTDVAIEAADVVLMSGGMAGVANARTMARRAMRNIRQNLFWAFAYNAALIPLAAGVFYPLFGWQLSPMLAAGAMALSSVFVVSNALRLRRVEPIDLMREAAA